MSDLLRRQAAAAATMARFGRKKFAWRTRATCIHLVRFHLRQMGHHPPPVPDLRSMAGAKQALADRGWDDVGAMMDTILPTIAPARMLLGDVAMMQDEDGIGSLVIDVGGKIMGWHDDETRMVVMEPLRIERAWRA